MASFWLQAQVHGVSLPWFRLVNVLLHAACALSLLALMRRCGLGEPGAWLASLVFLVHPLVTEPVMWLTGRHDTVASLLALLGLLAFPAPGAKRRGPRLLLASLCSAGAFASKEPYVVVPALVVALSLLERPRGQSLPRLAASWLAPVGGVLAVLVVRRALGIPSGSEQLYAPPLVHLQNYANIVRHYALLSVSLEAAPTIASVRPLAGPTAAAWLGGFAAVLLALWKGRASAPARVALLGVGWFLVALTPHVLSLPILGLWGNRYGYFPLMGLGLALGAGLSASEARARGVVRSGVRVVVAAVARGPTPWRASAACWRCSA